MHVLVLDSSGLIFAYCSLELLLHHLQSIYNISGTSDSPNLASMHLDDLVSPSGVTDTCRLHFQLCLATWWIRIGVRSSGMIERWNGWPRYMHYYAFSLLMLTCLALS